MGILPATTPAMAGQSDVNLFAGGNRLPPNIMIMLDTSGSMTNRPSGAPSGSPSKKTIAKTALDTLVKTVNPPTGSGSYQENARFGLFTFRLNGGALQQGISSGNTAAVLSAISGSSTDPYATPLSGSILDIARYFSVGEPWGSLSGWGYRSGESSSESSPFDFSCRDSFTIFMTDGDPYYDHVVIPGYFNTIGDSDGDLGAGEGGTENSSNVGVNNVQWTDDITKAMFDRDFSSALEGKQNVVTHVIGFDTNGANLQRMADNGGGLYRTAGSATSLASALSDLTKSSFDSLASYSTAVVPTSRTAFGSSFYNAFFNPIADAPFWEGHIEAFDLSPAGDILDASGNLAVDPITDELYQPHNPHWDAGVVLRSNSSRTLYTTIANARTPFTPTVPIQTAVGVTAAEVGTFPNSASSGISTTTQAETAVVNYLIGQDSFDEDNDGNFSELRPFVLGDIFHSTPVIVGPPTTLLSNESGYNGYLAAYGARQRVLYAGANDGMFHAFDAGSLTTGDNPLTANVETTAVFYTSGTGSEMFGYVPGLLLDDIKFVPRNNPRAYYMVDGSPVVADAWLRSSAADFTRDANEWSTVSIVGFREGGAGYLALDITDPSATLSGDPHGPYPKFLWEFTDPALGDAWSDPVITRVKVKEGTSDICGRDDGDGNCRERWVAIVGGGYETTSDPNHADFAATPTDLGWTLRSKAIFMIDLATGAVLAKVEYNAATNPAMIYGIPSEPTVLDLDFDGFADVVYIGDVGGQVWKWDISAIGVDSTGSDGVIDNWPHGIYFTVAPASDGTQIHYKSIFYPVTASLIRRQLWLAFATGEREALEYGGAAGYDENNRVYVIRDDYPMGASAFANTYVEANLTDVTSLSFDNDLSDQGYYFVGVDGEKFVSELIVFSGFVILTSFEINGASSDPCAGATGLSKLYAFEIDEGAGFFTTSAPQTAMEERSKNVGGGMASTPRISMAPDPNDDKMYIKTSKGRVLTIEPPPRDGSGSSIIYWKQNQ